jgi:2-succinyl-5-enolpyruvyl-6-hydroxy-3-cyclohexene-1-carboxylate synthase
MYTIQENVRIVVSLLKEYNIKYIVINPGGTNIPVAQAVQDDPFFHCYSVVDERSAMYFAIGLHLQTGEVIATSCTSAQATRNYIPGLTEAFYKHVPIIAITTSKLERYSYQQYMQAPDQTSLPVDSVKKSYDLPPVTNEDTRAQCCKLAKEGILESMHGNPGPVQINLRISDAQQSKFEDISLPKIPVVRRYMAWDDWNDIDLTGKKVLIVVGESRPFTEKQQNAIEVFTENYNAVVYTNHLSNYHGKYSLNANLLVSAGCLSFDDIRPDILITIGGQTGDYSIYGALNSCIGNAEHWRVCTDGALVDTYCHLTKIFECPFEYFFNRLTTEKTVSHDYFKSWTELEKKMDRSVELPFSNLYTAQQLSGKIPNGSIMNFAILNSLRCWNYFNIAKDIDCYANVAAFGIDGCTSMLIGESMNTDKLCFLATGDLAFFYDMNSLGIRHIKNNVRILMINNNEGAEFGFMTDKWKYKPNIHPFISAKGHYSTTKGWANDCGFDYISATSKEEFKYYETKFVSTSEQPIVFEVFTKSEEEVKAWDIFLNSNRIVKSEDKVKSFLKGILGEKTVTAIKKVVKK